MRSRQTDLLKNQSPEKIKKVWLLARLTALAIFILFGLGIKIATILMKINNNWVNLALIVYLVIVILAIGVRLLAIPWEYYFHRYQVFDEYIAFQQGWFFRTTTYVPFLRIQHITVDQGPFLRMENLATITIHTAATEHQIAGLNYDEATRLRKQVMDKVRQVEKDV